VSHRKLIATDLDWTLIYSHRFFGDDFDASVAGLCCVEIHEGEQVSFMTTGAAKLLAELADRHFVVPATTRTVTQFTRIALPGAPYRFAVVSNGGSILVDGTPDADWSFAVRSRLQADSAPISQVLSMLRTRVCAKWVRGTRVADGLFCYLVLDDVAVAGEFVGELRAWCEPRGWRVSQQGRKLYVVPRTLCKSYAVAEVRRRLVASGELDGNAPLLAAGDGALDADLLGYADAAARPAHGELHTQGWHTEGLVVTDCRGADAADQILEWFGSARTSRANPDRRSGLPTPDRLRRGEEGLNVGC